MTERAPRPGVEGKLEKRERKTPRELIIEAIRKNPDDWNQWQVFADMLLEAGDERGELIHLQHDLETKSRELSDEEKAVKWERIGEIMSRKNQEKWLGDLKAIDYLANDLTWDRGFVKGLETSKAENIRTLLERVKSEEVGALLSELATNATSDTLNDLLDSPACKDLKRWRSYDSPRLDAADMQAIADSENLKNLTSLDVYGNAIGPEGAAAIANSENLKNLTFLDVSYNNLGPDGIAAIAASENFPQLVTLNLFGVGFRVTDIRPLLASKNFPALRTVCVHVRGTQHERAELLALAKERGIELTL